MDTSDEYIKQCACDEIQGQWTIPPGKHDFVYHIKTGFLLHGGVISPNDRDLPHGFVFLPRQDQIQEMMNLRHDYTFFYRGQGRYTGQMTDDMNELIYGVTMDSMEQLWLTFYMFENHRKIWDSKQEQWIKSE